MVYAHSQPHEFPEFNSNVIAPLLIQLLIVSKNPQLSNFACPMYTFFVLPYYNNNTSTHYFDAKIAIFSLLTNKT